MKSFGRAFTKNNEHILDVKEILKERSERFRIHDSIFEEKIYDSFADDNESIKLDDSPKIAVQTIDFKRNGVTIFNDANAGQLFDEAILYSKLIQSKSPKMVNHPIYHISKSDLYQVILKGFLKQKMNKQTISYQISEFLFFLMSGHSSELLVEASFDTLKYQLQSSSNNADCNFKPWTPSIDNIKSVFINYGASKDLLDSNDIPIPLTDSPDEHNCKYPLTKFPKRNFFWVLKFISAALFHCKDTYSVEELDQLLIIILTVSLDRHFVQMETHESIEISKCVKRILKTYSEPDWQEKGRVSEVCEKLCSKLRNVDLSDLFFLISYYVSSSTGFGCALMQSLCYSVIVDRAWPKEKMVHLDNVRLKDIRQVFNKKNLVKLDYYTKYYFLLNLERCIIHIIFNTNQQAHLKEVKPLLSYLRMIIPKKEETIDQLLVKELITRTTTMWKLSIAEMT